MELASAERIKIAVHKLSIRLESNVLSFVTKMNAMLTTADDNDSDVIIQPARQLNPVTSTWPHLNSDVGLEKGEY